MLCFPKELLEARAGVEPTYTDFQRENLTSIHAPRLTHSLAQ